MSKSYYKKNDIPELYELFGLTREDSNKPNFREILDVAYQEKIKLCHPDAFEESLKATKEKETMMLNLAWNILNDETQRQQYNNQVGIMNNELPDFNQLKIEADRRQDTLGYKPPTQEQIDAFKTQLLEQNKKHGYNQSLEGIISIEESKKRYTDLLAERNNLYNEIQQPQLFDGALTSMDRAKFNEAFERIHKSEQSNEIIDANQWQSAYQGELGEYGTPDDYGTLYNDNVDSATPIDFFGAPFIASMNPQPINLTKEDIQKMQGSSNYSNYNVKTDEDYRQMKQRLMERKNDTATFSGRRFNDHKAGEFDQFSVFGRIDPSLAVNDRLGFQDSLTLEDRYSNIGRTGEQLNQLPPANDSQKRILQPRPNQRSDVTKSYQSKTR